MAHTKIKTDNAYLTTKLDLRRAFLRKYHDHAAGGDAPRVLDCCQGGGAIWGHLGREFELAGYWGVDVKPKKGRLRIDSVRILAQPGWTQNVVDVDTYGSPWKHWANIMAHLVKPTTVFLTIGQLTTGTVGSLDKKCYESAGMIFPTLKPAAGFGVKLASLLTNYVLTTTPPRVRLVEAIEATSFGNARYIGARLEPVACPRCNGQAADPDGVACAICNGSGVHP